MNHIEHAEQVKIFTWAFYQQKKYPCLEFMHASMSGEKFGNQKQAYPAKQAGMRAGVPDIFLPFPNSKYAGLFIELKRPIRKGTSKPTISDEQHRWIQHLSKVGYQAVVCFGAEEAIKTIENYLGQSNG